MNVSRRGFLGAMLAGAAAPAIVKAESLMKLVVPKNEIIAPNVLGSENVTWIARENSCFSSVVWNGSLYIAINDHSSMLFSHDGIQWNEESKLFER